MNEDDFDRVLRNAAYTNALLTRGILFARFNRGEIESVPTLATILEDERAQLLARAIERQSMCGVCHNPCLTSNMVSVTSEVDNTTGMATNEVLVCPTCIEAMERQQAETDAGVDIESREVLTHLGLERQ